MAGNQPVKQRPMSAEVPESLIFSHYSGGRTATIVYGTGTPGHFDSANGGAGPAVPALPDGRRASILPDFCAPAEP